MDTQSRQYELIQSRHTILELLNDRGYDTTPYSKIESGDLVNLLGNPDALRMELKHRETPEKKAIVIYHFGRLKQQVTGFITKLLDPESDSEVVDPATTEVIVITMEEIVEAHDRAALEAWTSKQLRIQFFQMPRLVNNPMKHVLQPKFEIVPTDQHASLLKQWYTRSKTQFPLIRFHRDPVARYLGLIPGDIVKITRPS